MNPRTLGDDMAELKALWSKFLGQFPCWVRPSLRWLAGDR